MTKRREIEELKDLVNFLRERIDKLESEKAYLDWKLSFVWNSDIWKNLLKKEGLDLNLFKKVDEKEQKHLKNKSF